MVDRFSVKLYVRCLDQRLLLTNLQLMNSNRYGESRAAYREVQERHADIQKIERTLTELAQLFNDVRSTARALRTRFKPLSSR